MNHINILKNQRQKLMVTYCFKNYLFYVNYKAGYSTFENMRRYGKITLYNGNTNDYTTILIVRNPYSRLESFYRDKMLKNMTPKLSQYCQQKLLNFFPSKDLINKKVSFEEFIKAIARGYADEHITPQSDLIKNVTDINYIIKMDNGLKELTPLFGFNPDDYIENTTNDVNVNLEWTTEMRTIVNMLYLQDFIKFNYKIIS